MTLKINLNKISKQALAKNFRYAVVSSVASKLTTVAVQIIAIPMAALSLGAHEFALYAMLIAAVGWLTLSNLGIGPTLVVRLAKAHVYGSISEESHIFSSAFFPTLIISAAVSLSALSVLWILPINAIFGPLYINDLSTIKNGLTALICLFFLQANISLFESAQAGYQKQYVANIFAAISSLPCILAVFIISKVNPTPVNIILALNVPVIIFKLINAVWIMRRYPHIIPSLLNFRWSISKNLLKNGIIFSLAGGIGNFLAHILPVIIIGRLFASNVSASFSATMNVIILASGITSMLANPLWPAISSSVAQGDHDWAKRAYRRLLWVVMTFGLLVALFLGLKGEWLFKIWFKGEINPSNELLMAAGLYFVALCWESAHFSILIGLHQIKIASILICMRSIVGVTATVLFISTGNEAFPFISMFMSIFIVDFIPLRKLVVKSLIS